MKPGGEVLVDLCHQVRPVIDQCRVELDGMRAGADFRIGVCAAGYAARADQVKLTDDFGSEFLKDAR